MVFPMNRLWFALPFSIRIPAGPGTATTFPGSAPAAIIAGEGKPRDGEENTLAEIVQCEASDRLITVI